MNNLSSQKQEARNLVVGESQRAIQIVTVPPTQLSDIYIYVWEQREKSLGFYISYQYSSHKIKCSRRPVVLLFTVNQYGAQAAHALDPSSVSVRSCIIALLMEVSRRSCLEHPVCSFVPITNAYLFHLIHY